MATAEGTDVRTDLPVRIRRFLGPPRGDAATLDHPNLPGVIEVQRTDDETRLVTLVPRGYRSLDEQSVPLDTDAVLQAVDALAAMHAGGVVHGDLGPHRVEVGPDGHLLLDGAGAAWRGPDGAEPSAEGDVRALAGTLALAGERLPAPVAHMLERAAAQREGPLDAARLAERLRRAAEASGAGAGAAAATDDDAVVKDLPPGGVYKSGETRPSHKPGAYPSDEGGRHGSPRTTRLPWRPLALFAGALVVGLAAVALQGRPAPPSSAAGDAFVVEVFVDPLDAPPLHVEVVEAPAGSEIAPGTRLGRAPRRIQLDASGRWVIRGVFGSRRSEPAAFRVPTATRVTLEFPSAGGDDGEDAGPRIP